MVAHPPIIIHLINRCARLRCNRRIHLRWITQRRRRERRHSDQPRVLQLPRRAGDAQPIQLVAIAQPSMLQQIRLRIEILIHRWRIDHPQPRDQMIRPQEIRYPVTHKQRLIVPHRAMVFRANPIPTRRVNVSNLINILAQAIQTRSDRCECAASIL